MKILVTGSNGMLGTDLCELLTLNGYDVLKTDINSLNITDIQPVENYFQEYKPDFVINCAAYTNVDKAEDEQKQAFAVNQTGAENLAKISGKSRIPIMYISTDYVFDGNKQTPYLPEDIPNPLNAYGLSKYYGEKATIENNSKHYIVRTSWLYGINGKNFVETMIELGKSHNELKIVSDQTGCPTWTVDLSTSIIDLIKHNKPYGIYHLCGSGKTSWYEFAKEIFSQLEKEITVLPVKTEDFPRRAKRPKYTVMDNNNELPNWQESLSKYLKKRSSK